MIVTERRSAMERYLCAALIVPSGNMYPVKLQHQCPFPLVIICSFFIGATKYSDKDGGGMLVWSPVHTIVDTKCKNSNIYIH